MILTAASPPGWRRWTARCSRPNRLARPMPEIPRPRRRAVLTGTGSYLPERVVTNEDMSTMVDTSDAWITERTGIKQRHFSAPHETAAFMGAAAARAALEQAGIGAGQLSAIIVATST